MSITEPLPLEKLFADPSSCAVTRIVDKDTKRVYRVERPGDAVFLYQHRVPRARRHLASLSGLLAVLDRHRVCVPRPVVFRDGSTVAAHGGLCYWGTVEMRGFRRLERSDVDFPRAAAVVRALGKCHRILRVTNSRFVPLRARDEQQGALIHDWPGVSRQWLVEVRGAGRKVLRERRHLCHGDLTHRNIVTDGSRVAFMDFDRMDYGAQIGDFYSFFISDPFPDQRPEVFHDHVLYDDLHRLYEVYADSAESRSSPDELLAGLVEWCLRQLEKNLRYYGGRGLAAHSTRNLTRVMDRLLSLARIRT